MPTLRFRLVTVDVDGTLTLVHGWREIARAFGREAEYRSAQRRFLARESSESEHLAALLDLATGRTVAEVEQVVADTPKLAGIAEGVEELHRRGSRVALLTHNPGYVTSYYRRTFGFDDDEGVRVPVAPDGRIDPAVTVRAEKPLGLIALIARAGVRASEVAHVGDGWSDAELFPRVGAGVAVNSSLPEVERAADVALRTRDFREVVAALARVPARR